MTLLVVQTAVDDYGSTHDEEIVGPWTMVVTENHPPSPSTKTTTKLMVACIIGMTAAVASSALFFYSILDFSKQTSTEESFLLHKKDGTCVVQSGPWTPPGTYRKSVDDDAAFAFHSPYSTCFVFQGAKNDYCWSRSYINKHGDWKPCKPEGYGSGGWTEYSRDDDIVNQCGLPCTEFEKN